MPTSVSRRQRNLSPTAVDVVLMRTKEILSTMLYYLWLRPNCCPLREERAAAKYKLKGNLSIVSDKLAVRKQTPNRPA